MKCNCKRLSLAALASFVFIFIYDFILHSKLLMGFYKTTAHLWRPEHDMGAYMGWMLLMQALMAVFMACIFVKGYENKGLGEGVRFGLLLGGILSIPAMATFAYMPIPFALSLSWGVGAVIQGVGVGIILSLIYKESPQ